MSWQHPFNPRFITSRFGSRKGRETAHRGTDYAPGAQKLIPAVTNGVVVAVTWSDCLGWVVVQASESGKYFVGYCHLSCSRHGINCQGPRLHKDGSTGLKTLRVGDAVEAGVTSMGRVGNTGKCSRGAHLHLTLGRTKDSYKIGTVMDFEAFLEK